MVGRVAVGPEAVTVGLEEESHFVDLFVAVAVELGF